MFEMLTGRQRARGLVLTGLNATVPPELEQIIGRMLAANVETSRAKRRDGRRRVPKRGGHSRHPHGSGGSR